MKKLLLITTVLILSIFVFMGCSPQNKTSYSGNRGNTFSEPNQPKSQHAHSPEELINNYFKFMKESDEKGTLACAGIVWDDRLTGFLKGRETDTSGIPIEDVSIEVKDIVYKQNSGINYDSDTWIKEWLADASDQGFTLEYTYDDIKSHGVVYFSLVMEVDEDLWKENGILDEPNRMEYKNCNLYVIETNNGWFNIGPPSFGNAA